MKLCAPVLVAGFILASPSALARSKRPVFTINSLKIQLKSRYDTRWNRQRMHSSVRPKILKMKRCFIAVVKKNPGYDGFLWLSAKFNKRGRVTEQTMTTTVKNQVAKTCLEWMVRYWKLPRGMVGTINAQVHIVAR